MSITTNVAASASTQAPNIVFVLADDLGWADLSVYGQADFTTCLLYTSPSPRDRQKSRMPSSA